MSKFFSFRLIALLNLLASTCLLATDKFSLAGGEGKTNATITVFAASSATDVLTDLAKKFEANHPVKVRLNFAASSVLARQIEQDAPCDVFLSADQKWMDYLADKHKIQTVSRKDIVGNRLVIVMPVDKKLTVKMEKGVDLAGAFTGRIAVGDPDHVPAGIYAKEALQSLGWWEALTNRLAPTENVRAALRLVELGEVDAGIVYLSDAKSSTKVVIAGDFPESAHSPIRYPAALCGTTNPDARVFLEFLTGKEAAAMWANAGFVPLIP
jgi:molybdate transport system substrate-binding protein